MINICEDATISQQDVIDAIKQWQTDRGDAELDTVLDFASDLTGLSVDKIAENLD